MSILIDTNKKFMLKFLIINDQAEDLMIIYKSIKLRKDITSLTYHFYFTLLEEEEVELVKYKLMDRQRVRVCIGDEYGVGIDINDIERVDNSNQYKIVLPARIAYHLQHLKLWDTEHV